MLAPTVAMTVVQFDEQLFVIVPPVGLPSSRSTVMVSFKFARAVPLLFRCTMVSVNCVPAILVRMLPLTEPLGVNGGGSYALKRPSVPPAPTGLPIAMSPKPVSPLIDKLVVVGVLLNVVGFQFTPSYRLATNADAVAPVSISEDT